MMTDSSNDATTRTGLTSQQVQLSNHNLFSFLHINSQSTDNKKHKNKKEPLLLNSLSRMDKIVNKQKRKKGKRGRFHCHFQT